MERHFLHEVQPQHHHARDPEKDDVEAGNENARGVVAGKLRRLFGPSQRGEGPQARREPGVEHVLVVPNLSRTGRTVNVAFGFGTIPPTAEYRRLWHNFHFLAEVLTRLLYRFRFGLGTKCLKLEGDGVQPR